MSAVEFRDWHKTLYGETFTAMREFTNRRDQDTYDQIWFTEHHPVFTQGQAGKAEHILMPGEIPVVQSDRGGQVTYHGPGQITGYLLFDLRRMGIGVRDLVTKIENSMITTLAAYDIEAKARPDAPGVYVAGVKVGSLGLRVRRGCSYHGLSLNVDMDLEPFSRINPCGLLGMEVTQMADFKPVRMSEVKDVLLSTLLEEYDLTLHNTDSAGRALT